MNHADPDGHKAVGTTIKGSLSTMTGTLRNAVNQAQNQTSKASAAGAAKSQNTAATTGIIAKASADAINRAAQEKAAHSQAKADFVSMPLDALNSAGASTFYICTC